MTGIFPFQASTVEVKDPLALPGFLLNDALELCIMGDLAAAIGHGCFIKTVAELRSVLPTTAGWIHHDASIIYGAALAMAAENLAVIDAASLGHACQAHGLSAARVYDLLEANLLPNPSMARRHATDLAAIISKRQLFSAAVRSLDDLKNPALSAECIAEEIRRNATAVVPAGGIRRQGPLPPEADAFYGLAGELVAAIDPHTESDRMAVLIHLLVMFGNIIGRNPHFVVDGAAHHLNLFAVCVGDTAKGRKGTAGANAARVVEPLDEAWAADCRRSGLSSGEGLIYAVRDPIMKQGQCVDDGATDKRLLIVECEFGKVLKVAARDGNTLSAQLRLAWDCGNLHVMTKTPLRAGNAHISMIGHITGAELRCGLAMNDAANGFGNRFLWVCVRRSKELPRGGSLAELETALAPLRQRLRFAADFARTVEQMEMTGAAWEIWDTEYSQLSAGHDGLWGMLTSRAEAQVRRLACLYALFDGQVMVDAPHLRAALAVWSYCDASAKFLFGGTTEGNATAAVPVSVMTPTEELVALVRNMGGRSTLRQIRQAKAKYRLAGVAEREVAAAISAGGLRWVNIGSTGGRPANMVEVVSPDIAVPIVSKVSQTAEKPTFSTNGTGGADGSGGAYDADNAASQAPVPSDDDHPPIWLEEANADCEFARERCRGNADQEIVEQ